MDAEGTTITDEETLARIRDLAIPPAWEKVWICPDPLGHIQATGHDEARREQYRYHDRWDRRRATRKYAAMREVPPAADPGDRRRGGDRGAGSDAPTTRRARGPVLAAAALAGEGKPASAATARRTIASAVETVATALGNTPAVCRRSYIDPRVFDRIEREVLDLIG